MEEIAVSVDIKPKNREKKTEKNGRKINEATGSSTTRFVTGSGAEACWGNMGIRYVKSDKNKPDYGRWT